MQEQAGICSAGTGGEYLVQEQAGIFSVGTGGNIWSRNRHEYLVQEQEEY